MKTLILQVPESVYVDALAFSVDERVRLVATAFRVAHEAKQRTEMTASRPKTQPTEDETITDEEHEAEQKLYAYLEANGIPRLQL